jgi:hypothetical protein
VRNLQIPFLVINLDREAACAELVRHEESGLIGRLASRHDLRIDLWQRLAGHGPPSCRLHDGVDAIKP